MQFDVTLPRGYSTKFNLDEILKLNDNIQRLIKTKFGYLGSRSGNIVDMTAEFWYVRDSEHVIYSENKALLRDHLSSGAKHSEVFCDAIFYKDNTIYRSDDYVMILLDSYLNEVDFSIFSADKQLKKADSSQTS